MPVYRYRGITEKGLIVNNIIEAESKQKVITQLRENGITPIEILQRGLASKKKKPRKNMAQAKEIFKEVSVAQINTKNETYLYSTYIGDMENTDDLDELNDVGKIYSKAQKYANTGFKLIDGFFEKSEEVVRLELLKELDEAYNKLYPLFTLDK